MNGVIPVCESKVGVGSSDLDLGFVQQGDSSAKGSSVTSAHQLDLVLTCEYHQKSKNQLNSGWCHTVIKCHLHYLAVTLLNSSVELSSNLDKPAP